MGRVQRYEKTLYIIFTIFTQVLSVTESVITFYAPSNIGTNVMITVEVDLLISDPYLAYSYTGKSIDEAE